jgi:hypothetical protein
MNKLNFLSAALVAAAMIAAPAMARENYVATQHVAKVASASSTDRLVDGRVCVPAPRVGAFATAPWSNTNIPCEP